MVAENYRMVDSYRAEEYLIDVDGSSAVYSDDFFMSSRHE